MDADKEKHFVKKFIIPEKQERILFELTSKKKRRQCIVNIGQFFNDRYLVYENKKYTEEELSTIVSKFFNIEEECYVIGDSLMDGKFFKFKEALHEALQDCGINCLLCGTNVVLIKEEASIYGPNVCIFVRNN